MTADLHGLTRLDIETANEIYKGQLIQHPLGRVGRYILVMPADRRFLAFRVPEHAHCLGAQIRAGAVADLEQDDPSREVEAQLERFVAVDGHLPCTEDRLAHGPEALTANDVRQLLAGADQRARRGLQEAEK